MPISRQSLGIAGAIVLALGVFAPIVRLPFVGTVNYFANGDGDGAIVLLLAAVAAGLILAKKYRLVLVPASLSLGMIAYTFINIQTQLHKTKAALDSVRILRGLGALAAQAVQFQWGWVVMLVGVALLGAAALMPEEGEPAAAAPPGGQDGASHGTGDGA